MPQKRHWTLPFVLLLCMLPLAAQNKQEVGSIRTVVIDAGHGGADPGALGTLYKEKDITLQVALQLGREMQKACPDVKVVYTRETDKSVSLLQRAETANKASADLFISIHCNSLSSRSSSPSGAETFVMGTTKTAANLEVAKIENSVIQLEDNYEANYEGFDPSAPGMFALFSVYQSTYLNHSLDFAVQVQEQLRKAGRQNRGVKQAGLYVLWKTAAPSVLIEIGFMTNPAEEKWMHSQAGRDKIVQSVLTAFKAYKSSMDTKSQWSVFEPDKSSAEAEAQVANAASPTQKAAPSQSGSAAPAAAAQPAAPASAAQPAASSKGIEFAVQVLSTNKSIPLTSPELKKYPGITEVKISASSYKYIAFRSASYAEAAARLKTVRGTFPEAFVTAFRDGRPMALQQARQESGQ